ncbi:MAG: HAD family hydrolase [Actinomycetota bacterium]
MTHGRLRARVLTFDLFSALVDSRTGGSRALDALAHRRGWPVSGERLYDAWDSLNKQAHQECTAWVPFAELAREAFSRALSQLGLDGDPEAGTRHLLGSVGHWPLWPDVETGLPALRGKGFQIGLLSNVDDDVFARTRAARLVDPDAVLTSERLRAYKPHREIYHRARDALPGMVHVATSARDVRGATEAGIPFVRLRRPGHRLAPGTPPPPHEVCSVLELADVVAAGGDSTTT